MKDSLVNVFPLHFSPNKFGLYYIVVHWFQFRSLKDLTFTRTNGKIVNPIDLIQIQKKAEKYSNFFELRMDILWFIHNCAICHATKREISKAARQLDKYIDEEILSIEQCAQCYENAFLHPQESFVMKCDQKHPIVWAKSENFDYWPAKQMSKDEDGSIHVRYFGEHTVDRISIGNYYDFALGPSQKSQTHQTELYLMALEVRVMFIIVKFKLIVYNT